MNKDNIVPSSGGRSLGACRICPTFLRCGTSSSQVGCGRGQLSIPRKLPTLFMEGAYGLQKRHEADGQQNLVDKHVFTMIMELISNSVSFHTETLISGFLFVCFSLTTVAQLSYLATSLGYCLYHASFTKLGSQPKTQRSSLCMDHLPTS